MLMNNHFVAGLSATALLISILACGSGGGSADPAGDAPPNATYTQCGAQGDMSCPNTSQSCIFEIGQACGTLDEAGECRERPSLSSCSTLVNEVCGCDGRTYQNACEAMHYGVSVETLGPCADDNHLLLDCRDAASWPQAWKTMEKEVVAEMNRRRAQGAICRGTAYPAVGPLVMDNALQQASRCHSLDMGMRSYFSHDTPEGLTVGDRITAAGYTGSPRGEVLAAGQPTAQSAVEAWMTSTTGHCEGVMNASANEIGVGYAFVETSPYRVYWTAKTGYRP